MSARTTTDIVFPGMANSGPKALKELPTAQTMETGFVLEFEEQGNRTAKVGIRGRSHGWKSDARREEEP
jgi:hypothetical protein